MSKIDEKNHLTGMEVAIIGMAGRFPAAKNIHEFWENLKNKVESISFFTEEELQESGVDAQLLKNTNYIKAKGILEDIEYFDAGFFDYTPYDAEIMDPQLRIFHECSWEVLEDAGYVPDTYNGLIGLFVGASTNILWLYHTMSRASENPSQQFAIRALNANYSFSTRVCYALNLKGPGVTVHTACSSSLVAVHLACQGLLSGECDMALAGGVMIMLPQKSGYLYQEGMTRSSDGHCRAFDAGANGTVFGDGVAAVVLKRFEDAVEDRDHIYAVIKDSASNNDGKRKPGYTAPSIDGQAEVIRTAYERAEIHPETIGYIETHGTGTTLGDPLEIKALKLAFDSDKKGFCAIGSVKTNVGHIDTAAGIASLIKVALALKLRLIPPSLNFETPNPGIDFENSPFYVNVDLMEWKRDGHPLRAGVSSFGIGGTNVHMILEEAPIIGHSPLVIEKERDYQLILLSAKTESALDHAAQNLEDHFRKNPGIKLGDAAYTLQVGRGAFPYRKMLVCSSVNEAIEVLSSPDSTKMKTFKTNEEERPTIFMFTGLGGQYVNMGREIYEKEPLFREEMDRAFEFLNSMLNVDIKAILYPPHAPGSMPREISKKINHTDIAQIVNFIFEYALAKLLIKWGIKADTMIGYSFGEYAAACISGVLSLEDALKLIVSRGQLIQQVPSGAMLSVPLSRENLTPFLNGQLSLAIDNGPSCIVAGSNEAVDAFEKQMKQKKLLCMRVQVSHALHSKMMEPILKKFEKVVNQVKLNKPQIPYISNVTGDRIKVEQTTAPAYWASHLRETVQFAEGIRKLLKMGNHVFIEIGPGRDLSTLVTRYIDNESDPPVINLIRPPQKEVSDVYFLLNKLGRLWLYGVKIDWDGFYAEEKRYRIPLPTYPFRRQRYWLDSHSFKIGAFGANGAGRSGEYSPGQRKPINDWFYIPSWKRTTILVNGLKETPAKAYSCCLVFIDDVGLGDQLVKKLEEEQHKVVTVRMGSDFQKKDEHQFIINPQPSTSKDYDVLFTELHDMDMMPDKIVHLFGVTTGDIEELNGQQIETANNLGYYSLLYIVQAIWKQDFNGDIQITVVTNNMHEVIGEDGICPGKATLLGPVRVIPEEYPNIRCRSLDVVVPQSGSRQSKILINQLFEELKSESAEPIIAYRGSHRWVQHFESLELKEPKHPVSRLKEKGIYLVTGGLGGIGFLLAQYLVKAVGAKLILTGRSALPPKDKWEEWLSSRDKDDIVSQKIQKVKTLEKLGSEVMVFSADVTDEKQMQQVIDQALEKFGQINGVIHAAGLPDGEIIRRRKRETSGNILAAKVNGTVILDRILKDIHLDFLVLCSSMASILGGIGQVGYCAANNFLDAFAIYNLFAQGKYTVSINWDRVQNIGIAVIAEEKHKKLTGKDLTRGITGQEAVEAFIRILEQPFPQVAVLDRDLEVELQRYNDLKPSSFIEDVKRAPRSENAYQRPQLDTQYAAPRSKTEKILANILSMCLGFERVGIYDDFFELGGDSLKALMAASQIHKELNVEVPIAVFFDRTTIETLAAYIKNAAKSEYYSIEPVEEKEYYSLSSAQERIYIIQEMDVKGISYNENVVVLLEGDLHRERIEDALKGLIKRHEALRTSIEMINNKPVQRINQPHEVEFVLEYYETGQSEAKEILKGFVRPFRLSRPPFFRLGLIKIGENAHIMIIDMHHIFADATSQDLFLKDLMALYAGKQLPSLKIQYKDYSRWQSQLLGSGKIRRQEEYWLNRFKDNIPLLNMSTDYSPLSDQPSGQGKTLQFLIQEELTTKLFELIKETETTIYMVLSAVCVILLSKYTGQEDIVVGTPTNGRRHNDLQNIIGVFVNVLVMRNQPEENKTFIEFLGEVKENALNAYDNQDYQFEELVRKLGLQIKSNRNPLFNVVFAEQYIENKAEEIGEIPGLTLKPYPYEQETTKFDLRFGVRVIDDAIIISLTYSTALFNEKTAKRIAGRYVEILEQLLENNDARLRDIKISHDMAAASSGIHRDYQDTFDF